MTFIETFEAPHLGMDTESAATRLAKGFARDVLNMLTGTPGRIRPRGGITSGGVQVTADNIWANGSGRLLLATTGSTAMKTVSTDLGFPTSVTASGLPAVPGNAYVAVSDRVYGPSGTGAFIRWDGGTASPTVYTNGPTGGKAITYWLNRLWYLGGKPAGGATSFLDRTYWSDLLDSAAALPDTLAAWQDDVSGLTNQIVLPSVGSGGNQPVGFGRLPNAMVVFGSRSGDMLVGSSMSNINVRARAITRGCVDRRSIVEYNGGLIWLAPEGLFYFDGVQEVELSSSIRGLIQSYTSLPALGNLGFQAVLLPNDYVLLTFAPPFAPSSHLQLLLHLPTRSWSRVTLPVSASPDFVAVQGTYASGVTVAVMHGDGYLWRLDGLTRPNTDWTLLGVDSTSDDTGHQPFQASYDSRVAMLDTPSNKAVVQRIMATSLAGRDAAPPLLPTEGWFVTARNLDDSDVLPKQQLTSAVATGINFTDLRHDVFEPNSEANQLYLHVEFGGSNTSTLKSAELQDIHAEYQLAQKPKSF